MVRPQDNGPALAAGHLGIQRDVTALLEVGLLEDSFRAYVSLKKAEPEEGPGSIASDVEQFLGSLILCAVPTMIMRPWGQLGWQRNDAPTWIINASHLIITSLSEFHVS